MILDAIRGFLGMKKKGEEKEIIITCERLERRVALMEKGRLEEFSIERENDRQISGSIYKGKVKNLEAGLKAMFVDIGIDKNAFLHYWDAIPAALDSGVEAIEREGKRRQQKRVTVADIPKLYPPGSDVIVQVTKGPIGTKGPRITTNISLPGRYLVLMPFSDQCGISRKIEDPKERQRLRRILNELDIPDGMGVIIRTVGEGQKARFFVRDLHVLLEQWKVIESKLQSVPAPALLLSEPDIIERTVRDFLTDDVDRIIIDDADGAKRIEELVGVISKRSIKKIKHYTEATPLFEKFGVEKQIESAFRRQVWLDCGGYLVIDETEALVAIDVNTGRNKGGKDQEKTMIDRRAPLVTLITDYGTRDGYVAELKGAILSLNPKIHLVDLTHEIDVFNLRQAAYLIDKSSREFPSRTIMVAVVDPGVGSSRDPLLLETKVGKFYLGPDNGIFSLVVEREGFAQAWKLDQPAYYRSGIVSATFHGRDIFGPVAAHLSKGVAPQKMGTALPKIELLTFNPPKKTATQLTGEILHIDHYGNIISNIAHTHAAKLKEGVLMRITIGSQTISAPLVKTYSDVGKGRYCLIFNSQGLLEVSINQGSAAKELKAQVGATFALRM